MVWPVSGSSPKRKVGSSSASLARPKSSFSFLGLGLRLDGARDDRLVHVDAAEQDGRLGRVHGVAGAGLLEPHGDHDAAGARALDALAAVGVHREEPGDLLVAPGARVLHFIARPKHAGIDAQEDRLAAFVHGDLEGQGAERGTVFGRSRGGLAGRGIRALDGRHFRGRGQEVAHGIEQRLHALVAQGRAGQHGHDAHSEGCPCAGPPPAPPSMGLPSRYAVAMVSSKSAAASISFSRAAATASAMAAGTSSSRGGSSSSPEK
jgi:hypothetical protein